MNISEDLNVKDLCSCIHKIGKDNELKDKEIHELHIKIFNLQYEKDNLDSILKKDNNNIHIQVQCKDRLLSEREIELINKDKEIRELNDSISNCKILLKKKNDEHCNNNQNYSSLNEHNLKKKLDDLNENNKYLIEENFMLKKKLDENIKYNSGLKGKESIYHCDNCLKLSNELVILNERLNDNEELIDCTLTQTEHKRYSDVLMINNNTENISSSSSNHIVSHQSNKKNTQLLSNIGSQSSNQKNIRYCNEFLNTGNCPYREKCYYEHRTREWIDENQPICDFFKLSKCCYGNQCRYSHKL